MASEDGSFVDIPDLKPGSSTLTAKPLKDIETKVKKGLLKVDKVILLTDGLTHSSQFDLVDIAKFYKGNNIEFKIIAVSNANLNLERINKNEESQIPGMDLVNYLGNEVSNLEIYNTYHQDVPYIGMINSSVNKNNVQFMEIEIKVPVIYFLNNLIEKINENIGNINWGNDKIILKKTLVEIGKLWSLLVTTFNSEDSYIKEKSKRLALILNDTDMTNDKIISFIRYGFRCARRGTPILLTNLEGNIKEQEVKYKEFSNAVGQLKHYGTTLNSEKVISLPFRGMCIISEIKQLEFINTYSNITTDKYGNAYFGIDANEQAIRIGLRNYANDLGMKDARGSPSVIFIILNQMSLMYIKDHDLNSEHMKELRKLAIIQTSMEGMVASKQYDGIGFYKQWKGGLLPKIHYSKELTHANLYTDYNINPLMLPEPLWWALMMSVLGIFNEQLPHYKGSIEALGINAIEEDFLKYIKETYKSQVNGNVVCIKSDPIKRSVFSLEDFKPGDVVFKLKDHKTPNREDCHVETYYTIGEINEYVSKYGCVWCKYVPKPEDYEKVIIGNIKTKIEEALMTGIKLSVNLFEGKGPPVPELSNITNLTTNMSFLNMDLNKNTNKNTNKKIVVMYGTTGSGKSTDSQIISEIIKQNGGNVLIVSAGKHSKKGLKGKSVGKAIKSEITNFDNKKSNENKVIIIDICNNLRQVKEAFGFNFSEYTQSSYYPQFNKEMIDYYEQWCLRNVLQRPMHDKDSLFWLNPTSAGVGTCIDVHKMKSNQFRGVIGLNNSILNYFEYTKIPEGLSSDQKIVREQELKKLTLNKIKEGADIYADYLLTVDKNEKIIKFLTDEGIIDK